MFPRRSGPARRAPAALLSAVLCTQLACTAVPTQALDPLLPPSDNFDLTHWKLTLPSGEEVAPGVLSKGYTLPKVFYTHPVSGGMVFRCPNLAGTTRSTRCASCCAPPRPTSPKSPWRSNGTRPHRAGGGCSSVRSRACC